MHDRSGRIHVFSLGTAPHRRFDCAREYSHQSCNAQQWVRVTRSKHRINDSVQLPTVRVEVFVNTHVIATRSWSTASYGDKAETSPMELSALGEHLDVCKSSHERIFALHCAAQSMHGFLAARFMTTLVVFAVLIGVAFLAL